MMPDAASLEDAICLACEAHGGQKYPSPQGEPYVLHLLRVMLAVEGESSRMAAVLHDILEDTPVTATDLRERGIPERVVDAVRALTHLDSTTYESYIETVDGDDLAREVKLADLADNLANNRRLPAEDHVVERIDRYERAITRLTRGAGPPDPGPHR
jgi:(p)ppGpp synthase/HD superfamily hydrolase